ncbi:hypothetical protein QJQ45_022785 [Haematococcus lacustris]|nr:hypothetical protein QJQ45_022785 [Haematococcus lacustris]
MQQTPLASQAQCQQQELSQWQPSGQQHQQEVTYDTVLFDDGSVYTGTLKGGVPDGLGTCTWKDGNQYDGAWKAGVMSGFGTYVWTSGQRYDGEWKEGKRHGIGVKKYKDGSSFEGFWREGRKHGVGVFRPNKPARRGVLRTGSGRLVTDPNSAGTLLGSPTAALDALNQPSITLHNWGPSGAPAGAGAVAGAGGTAAVGGTSVAGGAESVGLAVAVSPADECAGPVAVSPNQAYPDGGPPNGVLTQQASKQASPFATSAPAAAAAMAQSGPISSSSAALANGAKAAAGAAGATGAGGASGTSTSVPNASMSAQGAAWQPSVAGSIPAVTLVAEPLHPSSLHAPAVAGGQQQQLHLPSDANSSAPPQAGQSSAFASVFGLHQMDSYAGHPLAASGGGAEPLAPSPSALALASTLLAGAAGGVRRPLPVSLPETPFGMAYGTRALGNDGPSLASESVTSGLMAPGQGLELQRMKSGALAGEGAGNDKKVVYIRRFRDGVLVHEDKLSKEEMKQIFKDVRTKPKKSVPRTVKRTVKRAIGLGKKLQEKQGQLIYKGMPGYDLMVRLQLGIRYAIGQMQQEQQHLLLGLQPGQSVPQLTAAVKVQPSDFTAKSKVFFPASGSATTPAHASSDFKWKAYSPKVFHNLRLMWGVGSAEFMLSLAGSQALRQLNSPGKSGCLFFLSDDEQYIIKTMRKSEIKTLMAMLPEYYHHMERSKESLVTRFYGVYGVKQVHGRTVRFVVMSNIFATGLLIHKKFDLKQGSTFERTAGGADPGDAKSVFKDLDLDLAIQLPKALHEKMCGQLQADSQFLEAVGVMDYSLLLGVHFCARADAQSLGGGMEGEAHPQALRRVLGGRWQGCYGGIVGENEGERKKSVSNHKRRPGPCLPSLHTKMMTSSCPCLKRLLPCPAMHRGMSAEDAEGDLATMQESIAMAAAVQYKQSLPALAENHASDEDQVSYNHGLAPGRGSVQHTVQSWLPQQPLSPSHQRPGQQGEGEELQGPAGAPVQHTERAPRNFDIYNNQEEVTQQLTAVQTRMKAKGFDEQRIQDILGLAKLKILGEKLKKSKGPAGRGRHMQSGAASVVKALAQARQEPASSQETESGLAPVLEGAACLRVPAPGAGGDTTEDGEAMDSDSDKDSDKLPDSPRFTGLGSPGHTYPLLRPSPPFTQPLHPLDLATQSGALSAALGPQPQTLLSQCKLGCNMPGLAVRQPVAASHDPSHSPVKGGGEKSPETSPVKETVQANDKAAGRTGRLAGAMQGLRLGTRGGGAGAKHGAGSPESQSNPASPKGTHNGGLLQLGEGRQGQQQGQGLEQVEQGLQGSGAEEIILCCGIIDILQEYNTRKVIERGWKKMLHDGKAISVAPPGLYAQRFKNFMLEQVFVKPLADPRACLPAWANSLSAAEARNPSGWAPVVPRPVNGPRSAEPTSHAQHTAMTSWLAGSVILENGVEEGA